MEEEIEVLKVSPNPFTDFTSIEIPRDVQKGIITIQNTFGQIMQTIPFQGNEYQTIDGSLFPSGIYFIEVKSDKKGRTIAKVIKE